MQPIYPLLVIILTLSNVSFAFDILWKLPVFDLFWIVVLACMFLPYSYHILKIWDLIVFTFAFENPVSCRGKILKFNCRVSLSSFVCRKLVNFCDEGEGYTCIHISALSLNKVNIEKFSTPEMWIFFYPPSPLKYYLYFEKHTSLEFYKRAIVFLCLV